MSNPSQLSLLHRVFICSTHVLPQIHQFWDTFQAELGDEGHYWVSIGVMRLKLSELQESNDKARKIRVEGLKSDYEEVDVVLHNQELSFVLEAIQQSSSVNTTMTRLQDILALTRQEASRLEILLAKPEKGCQELCLRIWHLSGFESGQTQAQWWPAVLTYTDSSVEEPLHRLCDRIAVVLSYWKSNSYDSILVIVNQLTKMVYVMS